MNPRTSERRKSIPLNFRNTHHTRRDAPPEEELLAKYTPELRHLAHRFSRGDAYLKDDLFQEGAIGLVNAARRFDSSRGVKFSTLARRHIRGRMLNSLRKEHRHSKCIALENACYSFGEHDEQNPRQEDCLPITAADALTEIARVHFKVDILLMQEPLGAMAEILTPRQYEIFSMRYSGGFTP